MTAQAKLEYSDPPQDKIFKEEVSILITTFTLHSFNEKKCQANNNNE